MYWPKNITTDQLTSVKSCVLSTIIISTPYHEFAHMVAIELVHYYIHVPCHDKIGFFGCGIHWEGKVRFIFPCTCHIQPLCQNGVSPIEATIQPDAEQWEVFQWLHSLGAMESDGIDQQVCNASAKPFRQYITGLFLQKMRSLLDACKAGDKTAVENVLLNRIDTNCRNNVGTLCVFSNVSSNCCGADAKGWRNSSDTGSFQWKTRYSQDASFELC